MASAILSLPVKVRMSGALAGDSVTRAIKDLVNSVMANSTESTTFATIFEVGVKMDNNGKLFDSTKFSAALDNNYEQVTALFGGEKRCSRKS